MTKTTTDFPQDMDPTKLMGRIKKDLVWVLVSLAAAVTGGIITQILIS